MVSNFAFKFNLYRYTVAPTPVSTPAKEGLASAAAARAARLAADLGTSFDGGGVNGGAVHTQSS
jgi:hypothetical protein